MSSVVTVAVTLLGNQCSTAKSGTFDAPQLRRECGVVKVIVRIRYTERRVP